MLVVARSLDVDGARRGSRSAIPAEAKQPPHFEPLFMTESQIEKSLDSFPIEWLEIQERHLLLEGDDVLAGLEVPRTYLRLQCEHELRGKHIQLRQAYLRIAGDPASSSRVLAARGERLRHAVPHAAAAARRAAARRAPAHVIERVADLFELDAQGLLGAHLVRYGGRSLQGRASCSTSTAASWPRSSASIGAIDELRVHERPARACAPAGSPGRAVRAVRGVAAARSSPPRCSRSRSRPPRRRRVRRTPRRRRPPIPGARSGFVNDRPASSTSRAREARGVPRPGRSKKTGAQFAVLTCGPPRPMTPSEYKVRVFERGASASKGETTAC